MTTLSLEASKKVYELVGEYETEKGWAVLEMGQEMLMPRYLKELGEYRHYVCPAPSFAELMRVMVKIWHVQIGKGRWIAGEFGAFPDDMLEAYCDAPTEPEGMDRVESHLMKIL